MKHMGLSKNSKAVIYHYLTELEKEGVIKRIPAKWRGIKINERRNTTTIQ
jgi:SOS-response transcriptional repressor LexA